jgi:phenylalanyl-tRNA synthetase beta chain
MKISYNWLKWYIPEAPDPEKLTDIFNYHLCEMESMERILPLLAEEGAGGGDCIFDLKILPNRAHDLLSHQGVARELASLLNIKFADPTPKYKIPPISPSLEGRAWDGSPSSREGLKQEINSDKCRRYMGRIVRNVKVEPSPQWVSDHLASIGQRSINNIVDATNIVMYDCGQPAHVFDLNKVKDLKLQVRNAKSGEKIVLLGGVEKVLNENMMVIADDYGNPLDVAGIKGGKYAELTDKTTDIILECANFDRVSVRKTAQALNIVTDAKKRFENDLSPELAAYGMLELSALIYEMCPEAIFEEIVDVYPQKQEVRKLSFSVGRISKILGLEISVKEIEDILKRYNFEYEFSPPLDKGRVREVSGGEFTITIPQLRLDLVIEEDMAEEIGRILGYDKLQPKIPKINFTPRVNETYTKITYARNKLLNDGYSEVMNSTFRNNGEVSVMASASDKNFLRTNLTDGLKESLKLNQGNAPLLGLAEIKIFEIGTIWNPNEEMHVAFGDKKGIIEMALEEFVLPPRPSGTPPSKGGDGIPPRLSEEGVGGGDNKFQMWPLFPFIARDVAVWVPENVKSEEVEKIIKENMGDLVIRGPELFDQFKKDDKISYAFRLVFQSYEKTLTDAEVNELMNKITDKIIEKGWQVR